MENGSKRVIGNAIPDLARIPFLDYSGRTPELDAQIGRLPTDLELEIQGLQNGTFRQYVRTGTNAILLTSPSQMQIETLSGYCIIRTSQNLSTLRTGQRRSLILRIQWRGTLVAIVPTISESLCRLSRAGKHISVLQLVGKIWRYAAPSLVQP